MGSTPTTRVMYKTTIKLKLRSSKFSSFSLVIKNLFYTTRTQVLRLKESHPCYPTSKGGLPFFGPFQDLSPLPAVDLPTEKNSRGQLIYREETLWNAERRLYSLGYVKPVISKDYSLSTENNLIPYIVMAGDWGRYLPNRVVLTRSSAPIHANFGYNVYVITMAEMATKKLVTRVGQTIYGDGYRWHDFMSEFGNCEFMEMLSMHSHIAEDASISSTTKKSYTTKLERILLKLFSSFVGQQSKAVFYSSRTLSQKFFSSIDRSLLMPDIFHLANSDELDEFQFQLVRENLQDGQGLLPGRGKTRMQQAIDRSARSFIREVNSIFKESKRTIKNKGKGKNYLVTLTNPFNDTIAPFDMGAMLLWKRPTDNLLHKDFKFRLSGTSLKEVVASAMLVMEGVKVENLRKKSVKLANQLKNDALPEGHPKKKVK